MVYVRNAWYVAGWSQESLPPRPLGIRVLNEPIVIWRSENGDLAAFEDRCVHRLAPLSLGRCEGEKLRCMYHGLLYDRGGRVVEIPGQGHVANNLRVRTYPVVERYGWLWVWMGDAAAADEGLIPPVTGMDDPEYICGHGQLDYYAEARFVSDNLLDLSHVSFLHTKSAYSSETWAREPPKVSEHRHGVRIERWLRGERRHHSVDTNADKLADVYARYDFFVPGVFLMTDDAYPPGTADALDGQPPPDLDRAPKKFFALQAITPLTEKTSRSSYIMAAHRDHGGAAQCDATMAVVRKIFAEDKAMIEAQQRIIDTSPGWRFIATSADRGVVLYNRLVETLAREESTSTAN
jgi:phenylpropionate dioxygenase-like ring-hydroxylating dioxygenase large terminal subunit